MGNRKAARHGRYSKVPRATEDRPLPPAHSPTMLRAAREAVAYAMTEKKARQDYGDMLEAQAGKVYIKGVRNAVVEVYDQHNKQFWNASLLVKYHPVYTSYRGDADRMLLLGALVMACADQNNVNTVKVAGI